MQILLFGTTGWSVIKQTSKPAFERIPAVSKVKLRSSILDHCTEGHLVSEELVEEGYPVIVGPSLSERSKIELRNLTFETAGIL